MNEFELERARFVELTVCLVYKNVFCFAKRFCSFELFFYRRETEILNKLDHPNIAKMYEVIETEDTMNIVMEYAGRLVSCRLYALINDPT
jgi:hypothetical protein